MKIFSSVIISTLFLTTILNGCVSVKLAEKKIEKSKDFKFNDPPIPFTKVKNEHFDFTWRSQKTGNTITILSECKTDYDPTLLQLTIETAQSLADYQIQSNKEIKFNNRAALDSMVIGNIDGIDVKMKIRVFKKNGCLFTFNFFGASSKFDTEENTYDSFLNSVEVKHAGSDE